MSTDASAQPRQTLKEILSIEAKDLDEDTGIALTSLITAAVRDEDPKHDLRSIVDAVKESGCASALEPLTVIPIVVGSRKDGADEVMDLLATECSAKEVVMAVEEAVETLDRHLQSGDEDDSEDHASHVSAAIQTARLVRAYATTIPRLPRWKKAPKDAIESRLAELEAIISHLTRDATVQEARSILLAVSRLVLGLSAGADEDTKILLFRLVETTIGAFPNHFQASLARKAFESHFRRLVVPQAEASTSATSEDMLALLWETFSNLGVTERLCETRVSLSTLILLAHRPLYTFSISTLTAFFPTILSSLQANVALDEILAVLINTLAPLRSSISRVELEPDLIIPLVHLLPHVASAHPDPDIRHYTFRILSLVLRLSPPLIRFRLLEELLADEETPSRMRIAAIGLLKEAVLEGLSDQGQNIFASPHLLSTFGPIVLRPDPPDVFQTITLDELLDGPEPLRLVECLGFYYVLLQRDQMNRTGVRDADSLNNVQRSLIQPLETCIRSWKSAELASQSSGTREDEQALQLAILEMWTERVRDAVHAMSSGPEKL
ncbi:hypothetical protein BD414DRAFT_428621 [Trametes punicea]|nr:hypothetical protein BD414DRAFT_428621 [Trametes punicea]